MFQDLQENYDKIVSEVEKIKKENNISYDILILGVTKTLDMEALHRSYECNILEVGENRTHEVVEKYPQLKDGMKIHFIGHLQKNKYKYINGMVSLIHSIESLNLLKEINKKSKEIGQIQDVLIEVNISGEESKNGLMACDVQDFILNSLQFENVNVVGLMTMAPFTDNEEIIRNTFRGLRLLKEEINEYFKRENINKELKELSMGMSNDYGIAIEEGATIIRIGSSLYGQRKRL